MTTPEPTLTIYAVMTESPCAGRLEEIRSLWTTLDRAQEEADKLTAEDGSPWTVAEFDVQS
jgi:hypothetical protein